MAGNGLIPQPMMVLSFILFALYLTGLIATSIQLFGAGNVSNNCQIHIQRQPVVGPKPETLAWLEQNSICMFRRQLRTRSSTNAFPQVKAGMLPLLSGSLDWFSWYGCSSWQYVSRRSPQSRITHIMGNSCKEDIRVMIMIFDDPSHMSCNPKSHRRYSVYYKD
jgi:hypothetical protein